MTQNPQAQTAQLSKYLTWIVVAVILLASVALLLAGILIYSGQVLAAGLLALIGVFALAIAAVFYYQNQRSLKNVKAGNPKVMTTLECQSCKEKTMREFQRGDYITKESGNCPKCAGKQSITAIYREVLEKEKTYDV